MRKKISSFNKLKHDFEIFITEKSEIKITNEENNSIKKFDFNFIKPNKLSKIN